MFSKITPTHADFQHFAETRQLLPQQFSLRAKQQAERAKAYEVLKQQKKLPEGALNFGPQLDALNDWTPTNSWQPLRYPADLTNLELCTWTTAYGDALLEWLTRLRWPTEPEGTFDVTWFEMAFAFQTAIQHGLIYNSGQQGRFFLPKWAVKDDNTIRYGKQVLAFERSVESFRPNGSGSTSVPNWSVSANELEGYRSIFQRVKTVTGTADLTAAKALLEKSQLPVSELSSIYAMSDLDHDGLLAESEFLCAMAMAARRRQGAPLPEQLPQELREACWENEADDAKVMWQPRMEELSRLSPFQPSTKIAFTAGLTEGKPIRNCASETNLGRFLSLGIDLQFPGWFYFRHMAMAGRSLQFTGGIFIQTTRMYLKKAMERFGEVEVCHMGNRNNPEEEPPWVRFLTEKAAQDALDALDKGEVYVDGNQLKVGGLDLGQLVGDWWVGGNVPST
eukprot:symbB.v1.2.015916.t1/scaffold1171.1/size134081/11